MSVHGWAVQVGRELSAGRNVAQVEFDGELFLRVYGKSEKEVLEIGFRELAISCHKLWRQARTSDTTGTPDA